MEKQIAYTDRPWLNDYSEDVQSEIALPQKSVGQVFDEATETWEKRPAIIFYGKKIRYGELRDKVDRLANALAGLGIKKGDRIAFLMLNSPEHIIALFAALKVGAVITPVSPVYVSSEIKHQLADSGAETIFCQDILWEGVEKTGLSLKNVILTNIGESLPRVKKFMGKSILREVYQKMSIPTLEVIREKGFFQIQDLLREYSPDPPDVPIDPKEDLALLPYTGGTTGPPKGVMVTHFNVIADLTLLKAFYPIQTSGKETSIAYMPFTHASGQVLTLLDGIPYGHTLVTVATPDPDDILRLISRYQATFFLGAPTMFEILKDYKKTNMVNWKGLKIIKCGSDALNESTANDWKARTGMGLHEMYGMTETTAITHATPLGKIKTGAVGIPIPNTMSAVLDPEEDTYVPVGEIGEIVVNGPQISKGYWKNPGATKECVSMIDGIRWWRTGDLGKMDEDGYFFIYDRKRDLIKYKGYRVFAREVEEVLKTHPKIKEVGVIGVPDIKVGHNVKAMVVLETDARGVLSEMDIMEYCKDKLAHYKIPKIVEFFGEIPKTDVGKVSRRELREEE